MLKFLRRRRKKKGENKPSKISYIPWQLQIAVILFVVYVIFQDQALQKRVSFQTPEMTQELQAEQPATIAPEPEAKTIINRKILREGTGYTPLCGDFITLHVSATDSGGELIIDTITNNAPLQITLGETVIAHELTPLLAEMRAGDAREFYVDQPGKPLITAQIALIEAKPNRPVDTAFAAQLFALRKTEGAPLGCGDTVITHASYLSPTLPGKVLQEGEFPLTLNSKQLPIELLRLMLKHKQGDTLLTILPDGLLEPKSDIKDSLPDSPIHLIQLDMQ